VSAIGVLGTFAYDNLGRRTSLTLGDEVITFRRWTACHPLPWRTCEPFDRSIDLSRPAVELRAR
jgi:hypothetical protein